MKRQKEYNKVILPDINPEKDFERLKEKYATVRKDKGRGDNED